VRRFNIFLTARIENLRDVLAPHFGFFSLPCNLPATRRCLKQLFVNFLLMCRSLTFGAVMPVLVLISAGKRQRRHQQTNGYENGNYLFHHVSPLRIKSLLI
jgi:hypothetical protein